MYKILVKVNPKPIKKPKNPINGYFEANFSGWEFYKECGKTFQSENISIVIEKFEQLLYSIPAKDLKLINDMDILINFGNPQCDCDCNCHPEDESFSGLFDCPPPAPHPAPCPCPCKPVVEIIEVIPKKCKPKKHCPDQPVKVKIIN